LRVRKVSLSARSAFAEYANSKLAVTAQTTGLPWKKIQMAIRFKRSSAIRKRSSH
jgi:predicted mannosyl-3-phosphoglycerate phosphatase (HAD superfamily)